MNSAVITQILTTGNTNSHTALAEVNENEIDIKSKIRSRIRLLRGKYAGKNLLFVLASEKKGDNLTDFKGGASSQ